MLKKIAKKKLLLLILSLLLVLGFLVWWFFLTEIGKFTTITLEQDQEIHGVKFPKGTHVYISWNFRHATLSQDWEIEGKKYRKDDNIFFDKRGNIIEIARQLKEDTIIQGINCTSKGHPGHVFLVSFYESGKLMGARLSNDQEIQEIQFPKGSRIAFYESGRVQEAKFFQDCVIQGKKYPKNTEIYFNESGKITSVKTYSKK